MTDTTEQKETKLKKPDCVLPDSGREVFFDKSKISRRQWNLAMKADDEPAAAILAEYSGVPASDILDLSLRDFSMFIHTAWKVATRLIDPN